MAARTLAILCKVVTIQAMDVVINKVVGYLGDVKSVVHRQGAAEAIFREYLWNRYKRFEYYFPRFAYTGCAN